MDYIKLLQANDLKVTPQRLEILDILYTKGHINIDDLYKIIQTKFPTLSLATVYKNINTMCEKDFVSEVKIPNLKNVYEITKQEHSHVVCVKCNDILDVNVDTSQVIEDARIQSNFTLDKSTIIFNGVCQKCG